MGLVAAILTSMFIGSEYSDGTIRNKLVVGHSRMRIYLANLIVCSVACVLIFLAYITGVFVVGSAKGGELLTKTSVVTMCLVCSILVSVAFTSIMTMLAILNTNKAGNVVVSMMLALILLVSGSLEVEQLPNPQYIDGKQRAVLEVVNDLLPSGQAMQLVDMFDADGMTNKDMENAPYRWPGYSLLVIVITSGLGIILFRKKEIR